MFTNKVFPLAFLLFSAGIVNRIMKCRKRIYSASTMKEQLIRLILLFLLFIVVNGKGWEKMKKAAYRADFPLIDPPIVGRSSKSEESRPASEKKVEPAKKSKRDDPFSAAPKPETSEHIQNTTFKQTSVIRKSDLLNGPIVPDPVENNATEPMQGRSSLFGAVAGTAVSAVNAVGQTLRNWAGDNFVGRIGKGLQGIAKNFGQIKFLLFTQKFPKYGEMMGILNIDYTAYDKTKETIFIIHGFTHGGYYDRPEDNLISMLRIKDGFLKANFTSNLIVVDWTTLSSDFTYIFSSSSTATVADEVSDLIIQMVASGYVPSYLWVRIVGHSLGAHVSGITASKVFQKSGQMIARVDGLDPAGPNFDSYSDTTLQITADDAVFVQIIHCNKFLGTKINRGHVDFYPNGGDEQSGCDPRSLAKKSCSAVSCSRKRAVLGLDMDACSHVRCIDLFIESLTIEYKGCNCFSWVGFLGGSCPCQPNDLAYMGYYCDEKARGTYYLNAPIKSEYEKHPEAYVEFFNQYAGLLKDTLKENDMLPDDLKNHRLMQELSYSPSYQGAAPPLPPYTAAPPPYQGAPPPLPPYTGAPPPYQGATPPLPPYTGAPPPSQGAPPPLPPQSEGSQTGGPPPYQGPPQSAGSQTGGPPPYQGPPQSAGSQTGGPPPYQGERPPSQLPPVKEEGQKYHNVA